MVVERDLRGNPPVDVCQPVGEEGVTGGAGGEAEDEVTHIVVHLRLLKHLLVDAVPAWPSLRLLQRPQLLLVQTQQLRLRLAGDLGQVAHRGHDDRGEGGVRPGLLLLWLHYVFFLFLLVLSVITNCGCHNRMHKMLRYFLNFIFLVIQM